MGTYTIEQVRRAFDILTKSGKLDEFVLQFGDQKVVSLDEQFQNPITAALNKVVYEMQKEHPDVHREMNLADRGDKDFEFLSTLNVGEIKNLEDRQFKAIQRCPC